MANELKHGSVGTELTQAEWEAVGAHVFANQAAGDILYAISTSQLSRLGKQADNTVLHLASGIPAWSATLAGLTLTTPTISSTGFANANHAHAASNSGGTVAASALSGTSLASGVVTTSATTVGVLNSGSINTGFGNIDNGSSTLDTGAATVASLDVSNGSLLNVGNANSDWDSTSLRVAVDTFSAATKHMVVGHTATVTGTHAATFEVLGTGLGSAQANIGVWSADAYGPAVTFIKSRHASIGSNTIVQDNDLVGRMIYMPDDGTDFATRAAQFHAEVDDASPATGDIGMSFVWQQMAGGGGALAETMRLSAAGKLSVAGGLESVGASGNDWTATTLSHDGTGGTHLAGGFSTQRRDTSGTNTAAGVFRFENRTDGDMADGFGVHIQLKIGDASATEQNCVELEAIRAGADNSGQFAVNVYDANTRNQGMILTKTGVLSVDLSGSGSAAQVDLFDEYDDATELQRFAYSGEGVEDLVPEVTEEQRLANRERMVEMGILIPVSEASSGYHMRIQPLTRLLAGGIYQNRHRMDSQYEELNKRLEAIGA